MLAAACGLIGMAVGTAHAADPARIHIELNKLEQQDDACRAYVLTRNDAETAFDAFALDLVLLDKSAIIMRRLAVDIAPLRTGKSSVKTFSIKALACADIGRILLNDVLTCTVSGADRQNCAALIETSSRSDVDFID